MAIRKLLAYAAIYVLWGASFLAIRQVVAVAPPFFSASFRFLCAGAILYAYSCWRGIPQPNKRQLTGTAVLGLVMFAGRLRLPLLGGEGSPFRFGGGDRRHHSRVGHGCGVDRLQLAAAQRKGPGRHCPGDSGGYLADASRGTSSQPLSASRRWSCCWARSFGQVGRLPAAISTCRGNSA